MDRFYNMNKQGLIKFIIDRLWDSDNSVQDIKDIKTKETTKEIAIHNDIEISMNNGNEFAVNISHLNAQAHVYEKSENDKIPKANILAEVMTFAEATKLYGLPDSVLRKSVDKFEEHEIRKSGGTWLVTREGMHRLFKSKASK